MAMTNEVVVAKKRRFNKFGYDNLAGITMSAPAVILLILFVLIPFFLAFFYSLYNVRMGETRPATWMGFEQYRRILFDPDQRQTFIHSLRNNFVFTLIVVPVQTTLAVLLAVFLNQKVRGIAFFRTFFFMPVVFPMTLVVTIWSLIFSRDTLGMLNGFLDAVTFGGVSPIDWLGDPKFALASIAMMSIWAGVGFQMVIVLAGIQEISPELYEAASIDRAGKVSQFFNITIPGLRNTLIFVVMITTIFSLRLFDQVYLMTSGGPLDATTTVMFTAVTSAFQEGNVGAGSAMTVVFVVIIVAITLLQKATLRQDKEVK